MDTTVFLTLVGLGAVLTALSIKFHYLPLSLSAAVTWLVLTVSLVFGGSPVGTLAEVVGQVFGLILVLLIVTPIGFYLMRVGKQEMTMTKGGKTFKMWAKPDSEEDRSARVKRERKEKMRNLRMGRR